MDILREIIELYENGELKCLKKAFKKGEFVHRAGERFKDVVILKKGKLKVERVGRSGKILEIERIEAPDFVLPCITFSDRNVLDLDLIAMEPTEVLYINKEKFFEYIWGNKKRTESFSSYFGRQFYVIVERLTEIILSDLREKIASYLLKLYEKQKSRTVKLEHTREELAKRFGATRPSISRIFSEFADKNIIKVMRGSVKIIDLDALQKYAE